MLEFLGDIANLTFSQIKAIWVLYTTSSVLAGFLFCGFWTGFSTFLIFSSGNGQLLRIYITFGGFIMAELISQFGTIATAIFSQVGTVASTIVSTPLLLFTTGFLFLGGCVGIFGRLLSRN